MLACINTIIITFFVRLSPECSFVLEKKGKQFIEDFQVKLKTISVYSDKKDNSHKNN